MGKILKNRLLVFYILVTLLLLAHGLFDSFFKIDNTTVLLLIILLLLPYFGLIKKIKYGDFEAEITHQEVSDMEKRVEQIEPKKPTSDHDYILELAKSDIQLALAKIRIEMEKRLDFLNEIYIPKDEKKPYQTLREIVWALTYKGIIDDKLAHAIQDALSITNRAIHGESISEKDAYKLADSANKLLAELDFVVIEHALKSTKEEKISKTDIKDFLQGSYKLTTIALDSKNPVKKIYMLNQTELYAFLESFDEKSEILVGLKRT